MPIAVPLDAPHLSDTNPRPSLDASSRTTGVALPSFALYPQPANESHRGSIEQGADRSPVVPTSIAATPVRRLPPPPPMSEKRLTERADTEEAVLRERVHALEAVVDRLRARDSIFSATTTSDAPPAYESRSERGTMSHTGSEKVDRERDRDPDLRH
jgi:hypothetical protein